MSDELIYNPEIETAALAHVLRNPADYTPMADMITAESFGWRAFGWVWETMGRLSGEGLHIDAVTIGDALERAGRLAEFTLPGSKQATGRAALSQLREVMTTRGGGATYAAQVADYAAKRAMDEWFTTAHNHVHNGRTAASIVADVTTKLGTLSLPSLAAGRTNSMEPLVIRARNASERAAKGDTALDTGLIDLDNKLRVQRTELVTVCARPGQGKSSLLATILINAARAGKRGLLFSAEMGATQITQRLISQLSGMDCFAIMNGKLQPEEWDRYYSTADDLADLPITICDMPAVRIGQIRTETRKTAPDYVLVDYIQLIRPEKKNDRRDLDIGEVTMGLKAIAVELDIPVIAAAQLSRATEQRADKMPALSDLRESGSIENDSDSVVAIYRPDQYGTPEQRRQAQLIILKHRNGPVGTIDSYFDEPTMTFRNSAGLRDVNLEQYPE